MEEGHVGALGTFTRRLSDARKGQADNRHSQREKFAGGLTVARTRVIRGRKSLPRRRRAREGRAAGITAGRIEMGSVQTWPRSTGVGIGTRLPRVAIGHWWG